MKLLKTNEEKEEILGNKFMEQCCITRFEALEDKPVYTQKRNRKEKGRKEAL